MNKIEPIELIGQRAKLVPLEASHVTELFQVAGHSEIWSYMPAFVQTLHDMNRVAATALAAREAGNELPFVIIDQHTGQIVGSTRLMDISLSNRSVEIGWTWLTPSVWRTRINTECKYLLLRHAFEELGMVRIQLKTDGRNLRSQAAIERLGAVKEGVLRRHRLLPDGYIRDSVYYSILDSEWPSVQARLESILRTD